MSKQRKESPSTAPMMNTFSDYAFGAGESASNGTVKSGTIVINATDYGADPSGKGDSAVGVWNALEAAKTLNPDGSKQVIVNFPKGEYHIYKDYVQQREYHTSNTNSLENPVKWFGILIEDQKNLTLEGNGSLFIMHGGYMAALGIVRSENIKLHDFSWDYGVPTLSEMTVLETSRTGADGMSGDYYTDYFIPSSNPFHIENGENLVWESEHSPYTGQFYWQENNYRNDGANAWACNMYFDPSANVMIRTDSDPFNGQITKTGENTIRITSREPRPNIQLEGRGGPAPEKPGMVWAFSRMFRRTTAGAFNWESKNILVEKVNVHYMHGFGWLTQMCENVTYESCNFMPREGSGRHVTGFADLIHVSGGKGTIRVENTNFSFPQDDHINVHGTFIKVNARVDPRTLDASYVHSQQGGFPQFHVGDEVAIATSSGLQPVGGKDKLYTVARVVNPFENGNTGRVMQVTFTEDIPEQVGSGYVLENVTYTPDVVVRGNYFGVLPTRAVLCTTRGKVLFEDNTFIGSTMAPLYLSNDSSAWYESGPIRDFTFRNNTVYTRWVGENEMVAAFHVHPIAGTLPEPDHAIHENINIIGNTFYSDSRLKSLYSVYAESVNGLNIKDNKFLRWNPDVEITLTNDSEMSVGGRLTLTTAATGMQNTQSVFGFSLCKNVTIEGNTYDDGMKLKIDGNTPNLINMDEGNGLSTTTDTSDPVVRNLTYVSSDPAVATVDSNGNVTGVSAGTTQIFACYEWPGGGVYRSNEVRITVSGAPAPGIESADNGKTSASCSSPDSPLLADIQLAGKRVASFTPGTTDYVVTLPCELRKLQIDYTSENAQRGTTELYVDGMKQEGVYANTDSTVLNVTDGSVVELCRLDNGVTTIYRLTLKMRKSSNTALTAISMCGLLNGSENLQAAYVLIDTANSPETDLHVEAVEGVESIYVRSGYNFLPVENAAANANEFSAKVCLYAGLNPFFITVTAADGITEKTTMVHVVRSGPMSIENLIK